MQLTPHMPCAPQWVLSEDTTRERTATGWRVRREVWFIDRAGDKDCVSDEWDEPD